MKSDVFNTQMDRLKSVFGERAFTPERLKLIWQWTEFLADHQFSRIVSFFISSMKTPPLPADFRDAARKEKSSEPKYERDVTPTITTCGPCGDLGLLRLISKADGHTAFCRCNCFTGMRETWKLPMWTITMESLYSRDKITAEVMDKDAKKYGGNIGKNWQQIGKTWRKEMLAAENYWNPK